VRRRKAPGRLPAWKKIFTLGQELLTFDSVEKQIKHVLTLIESWYTCQVFLWLDENTMTRLGQEIPTHSQGLDDQLNSDILIKAAFNQIRPVYSIDEPPTDSQQMILLPQDGVKIAVFPLYAQEEVLGVIKVSRSSDSPFKKKELALISDLVEQSASAILIKCRLNENDRKLNLLSLVRSVSSQIADLVELNELFKRVTSLILLTFRFYYVAIFTIEEDQEELHFRDSAGPLLESLPHDIPLDDMLFIDQLSPKLSVRLGEGIIGYAAQFGTEIIANDIRQESHFQTISSLPDTKSELALPLMVEDRILGVIDIQSDRLNAFSDTDILVLRVLADNIATAVENARLYGDAKMHIEQLAIISDVNRVISSILDIEQLFKEFIRILHERLHYSSIHIFDIHEGRRKLFYQAGDYQRPDDFALDLDTPDRVVQFSARIRKTVISNDLSTDEWYPSLEEASINVMSEIALPLIFGNLVLGVLYIQSEHKNAFSQDDVDLLEALTDNLAVVMRNVNLYRSEVWRRQVADSMREVASQLTTGGEFELSLNLILSELPKILPCDFAAIWLSNSSDEFSADQTHKNDIDLMLEAVYLLSDIQTDGQEPSSVNLTVEEIKEICNRSTIPNPWLEEVLMMDQPVIRQPGPIYETIGAILNYPEDYSAIAAPLVISDRPLGVLVLGHHTPSRYGSEAQTMTATFASYAAVAIDNSRLLDAAHDQAWVSTVLLQVSEATQSTTSLDDLLTTVVNITPTLVGIDICMIFLWDNLARMFLPMVEHGLDEDQKDVFTHCIIAENDHPIFDQLISTGKVVFYDGEKILQQAEITHMFDILVSFNFEKMNLAIYPLSAHGEFLGAFVVNYHPLLNSTLNTSNLSNYAEELDEKLSIIQGIAHQTSIAVENIQLIKAQREEAYVSVALLQVAQAVSSTNSLDEILESIVRLTPILTGIVRCIIYLWEENTHTFIKSQSYGIPRNVLLELQSSYQPLEYPLLEVVRHTNAFAYHIIQSQDESPVDWHELQQGDFFVYMEEIDKENSNQLDGYLIDSSRNFLQSVHALLMAYPITIKGSVLGVILFEEPASTDIPITPSIREKRHEISVGITQQTALAIQNDLYQREIVEQERMERELQLAREIQQTFLPETKPLLDGWELEARWQPAREVGGDFYDFFELPDRRLGLVIADVADKGMPAALFMTLARTLLRSSAREYTSPAAVLAHVNDLLVSDTKRGLFVTVVYGILTLDTGEFVYANAGHNYPIILDVKERELQVLPTTGMALGVLSGIDIQDTQISIASGDSLILYTDGITEAFSENGEMFGEPRLYNAIKKCMATSASEITHCIEETLARFVENTSPSDDVTLITLSRKEEA
jgi:sigma-B regulation protein RsbU (phosphoserine phosphatase)